MYILLASRVLTHFHSTNSDSVWTHRLEIEYTDHFLHTEEVNFNRLFGTK